MKKLAAIILCALALFSFAGCGGESQYAASDITAARDWLSKDMWNKGLCNVQWYIETGKDATGADIDIDYCIDNLKKEYENKSKHDAAVHALDSTVSEQERLIGAWDKTMEQLDVLVGACKNGVPAKGNFNTELYEQYNREFQELYTKVIDSGDKKMPVFANP